MVQLQPRDYVRAKDRQKQNGDSAAEKNEGLKEEPSDGVSDDDVPF